MPDTLESLGFEPETKPADALQSLGFEPVDPIHAKLQSAEDLPPQEHFDQAHQSVLERLRATLANPSSLFEKPMPVAPRAQPLNDAAAGVERWMDQPLVPVTKMLEPSPNGPSPLFQKPMAVAPRAQAADAIAGGVERGGARLAEGLTTPMNVALLAGTGAVSGIKPLLGKAISTGFGLSMLKGMYDKVPEVRDAVAKKDWPRAAQAITEFVGTGAMVAGALTHAASGEAVPRETPVEPTREAAPSEAVGRSVDEGLAALGFEPEQSNKITPEPPIPDVPETGSRAAQLEVQSRKLAELGFEPEAISDQALLRGQDRATEEYHTDASQQIGDELKKRHPDVNFRRIVFKGDGYYILPDAEGKTEGGPFPNESAATASLIAERKGTPTGKVIDVAAPAAKPADIISAESKAEPQPTEQAKAPWMMSPDELAAAETEAKGRDAADLLDLFGPEGAQRYKRLERVANSSTRSHEETAAASGEMEQMEAALPEAGRNRLFGIGDTRPQLDEIQQHRQALGRLDWSSPEALGDSLKYAVTGIGDKADPATMTTEERTRYAQLRYAMGEAQRLGWDPVKVSDAALRGAAGRFDVGDAGFMLKRFAGGEATPIPDAIEAAQAKSQPVVDKATLPGTASLESLGFEPEQPAAVGEASASKQREPGPLSAFFGETKGESDPFLGAQKFAERDLKPAAIKVASAFTEGKDQALRLVAPQLRGDAAEMTGLTLRERMAQFARRYDQAKARLKDAWSFFNNRTPEENYSFMDEIEQGLGRPRDFLNEGTQFKNADLEPIAKTLGRALDQRRKEVQALGEGALDRFYEHYFPHIFEKPEAVPEFVSKFFRETRPNLEGPKSFLKHRQYPTMKEARDAGLKPISDNPIDLVLAKIREMDRYLLAHNTLRDMADRGVAKRIAPKGELKDMIEGPLKKDWLVPTKDDLPQWYMSIHDPIGGGKWYADEGAAQVLNNYLMPGLRQKSGAYRIAIGLNNSMNQANLGLSAFHMTGEAIRSVMNRGALGLKDLFLGNPVRGSVRIATAPAGPFIDYLEGAKGVREWFKPGSEGAPIAAMVDGLLRGGARVSVERDYVNGAAAQMMREAKLGNYPGAAARLIPAFFETAAKPMMQQLIPRMKLGAAMQMAEQEFGRLPEGASVDDVRRVMAKVWDSADNRMGQMVYDNLFWDKTLKDIAHLTVRAVGWDLGTVREFGFGAWDAANLLRGKKPVTYDRIAYTVSAAMTTALAGAMYQYLHTGKGPQEVKDYFFPKREDGSRVSMPTDVKDVYHYATNLPRTLENKASPLLNTIAGLWNNRDFYDRPIRGEDDPLYLQGKEVLEYLKRQTLPFTLQQMSGKQKYPETSTEHTIEKYLGITRASGDIQDKQTRRPRKSPYR